MFGISHLKLLLNSSHPWGGSFFVGIFWGQVDGGEVPVWTPRRRTGWQFRLVNVQHALVVRPWKNLYISYRQFDPGRQVGEHDEIRGRTCEGLRSISWDSDAEEIERSNCQPHSLRSSWLVYGRDWMVFNEKPLFSTSEDWRAQGPRGVRKSAHVTWGLRRQDAQCAIHSPQRFFAGDSAPKKGVSRESWEVRESTIPEFATRRIGQIGKVLKVLQGFEDSGSCSIWMQRRWGQLIRKGPAA